MMVDNTPFNEWLHRRLLEIREEQARFDAYVPIPPASAGELGEFERRVAESFPGVILPQEYLCFLSMQNGGGQHAGMYGTNTFEVFSPAGRAYVTGFLQENLRLRSDATRFANLVAYGETDLDYIVQDIKVGSYRLQSKIGADSFRGFANFEDVIRFALT